VSFRPCWWFFLSRKNPAMAKMRQQQWRSARQGLLPSGCRVGQNPKDFDRRPAIIVVAEFDKPFFKPWMAGFFLFYVKLET